MSRTTLAIASLLLALLLPALGAQTPAAQRNDRTPRTSADSMGAVIEPLFAAVDMIRRERGRLGAVVLLSPQGRRFTQAEAERFAGIDHVAVLCGRYEGVDDRVRTHLATDELSIGDYVLTGGELPALVFVDAVARLVRGVVGDEESVEHESFSRGLLDFPQYTRPAEFRDLKVPDVLLSGHHAAIRRWRKRQAVERTFDQRPDLLALATLDDEEREMLAELKERRSQSTPNQVQGEQGGQHGRSGND